MNPDSLPLSTVPVATPFDTFMAKVAGEKLVYRDGGYEVTAYRYRGAVYITSLRPIT